MPRAILLGTCLPVAALLGAALPVAALLGAALLGSAAWAQNPPVAVAIDAKANAHAISPLIYGVAFASQADLIALNAPLNRSGGNNMSTYSWRNNAQNLDSDYYFESYPQPAATPGAEADSFVGSTRKAGAAAMLTVPMLGWVAKLGVNRTLLPSYSVAKYGAQCRVDPYFPDAGNGQKTDCRTSVAGNDPHDAYIADPPSQEAAWVAHLVRTWGHGGAGGVPYYLMDNEASLWFATHRDIHPIGAHAQEYRAKVIALAAKIKAQDPTAKIVAPEEWGWDGYRYSGFDQQYGAAHGYASFPDHVKQQGGMDYIPWLLTQWKAAGHPVDVVSVHFYPQANEFSDDVSTATQLLRNRSTRQLWDPGYVSESWIGAPVYLIPRLRGWVAANYYPGTPVAITEYNWGAEGSINGATAQADIYGIFGVAGLDMATRWTTPAASTPTYKAMQLYRNYDGHGGAFGDTSVAASAPNPDTLAAFAALRASDGALTVMAISKVLSGTTPLTLSLANFSAAGTARAYRLTAANVIAALPPMAWSGGTLTDTLPAQSVTLYVLPN
jgi:Glycoside hydrolase family 44